MELSVIRLDLLPGVCIVPSIFLFFLVLMFLGEDLHPFFIYLIEITDTCCEIFILIIHRF